MITHDKEIKIGAGLDRDRALVALDNYMKLLSDEPERRERLGYSGGCVYVWGEGESAVAMIAYHTKSMYIIARA